MTEVHCDHHGVFTRSCQDCLDSVRDRQIEEFLLDQEADQNQRQDQNQDQGQDRFASIFENEDEGDGVLTDRGYIEGNELTVIPDFFDE